MGEKVYINICGVEYEVLDSMNNITLADSFVRNKTGYGHGEAKLYVGNVGVRYSEFFDDLNRECFFVKDDFRKYLNEVKREFYNPQQEYVNPQNMPTRYNTLTDRLSTFPEGILIFTMYRKDVEPPRVYLQSESEYYDFMRDAGLPNVSYLSIMKVKEHSGRIWYYFRMFTNLIQDLINYNDQEESEALQNIENASLSPKDKLTLVLARRGQGIYRKKLLLECPFCPISLINDERLLIASHIKPWVKSNNYEKIDPKNGLMLSPNYDTLFDKGFITFNSDKKMLVSPWINPWNQNRLRIYTGMLVPHLPLDYEREKYMAFHRAEIYKG